MTLTSAQPEPAALAVTFPAIGTTNRIVATHPAALIPAQTIAQQHLAGLDAAVSRFRPDSQLMRICEQAQRGPVSLVISSLLADYLNAALQVAQLTDGLVDPTIGAALQQRGYDQDMEAVRARREFADPQPGQVPGWQQVQLDSDARRLTLPQGMVIDLGSSAKAHAADTIARMLAQQLPGGFLVDLGGDIAVSGQPPARGWHIGIVDPYAAPAHHGERFGAPTLQTVVSTGQAITTSSTQLRTWSSSSGQHHHILDPRTGCSATPVWLQVTCVASSALQANAASTAAIIHGADAPGWLAGHGLAALLVGCEGQLTLTADWPDTDLKSALPWVRVSQGRAE